ncbi:MAG TPA: hypothetical protein VNZ22_14160, partial [Bacillota bacterium]|nr:hypothetical protein [Bacillota bacterium]
GLLVALVKNWPKWSRFKQTELRSLDGQMLDQEKVVGLLQEGFDCILMNLRLPAGLSLRLGELAHLARVPTRLFLLSGAPAHFGSELRLFDGYLSVPFTLGEFYATLDLVLAAAPCAFRNQLPNQEQIDSAVLSFFRRYPYLGIATRSPLLSFGLYRDTYLHGGPEEWDGSTAIGRATMQERVEFFAGVRPLRCLQRIDTVVEQVQASSFYDRAQKRSISLQLHLLANVIGLTLVKHREETAGVLDGLELFGRIAEEGSEAAYVETECLKRSLLTNSEAMPFVHRALMRLIEYLPEVV